MGRLETLKIKFPIFLPDATRAVTKCLDSADLHKAGVKGVVVNTFHLRQEPGLTTLKQAQGIKNFMNFDGLVVSDSGGWQVFSLIKRSNLPGKITDEGVMFNVSSKTKELFTPEKSIQTQFAIGSDIVICLDDFADNKANRKQIEEVVERTVKWAKRSKEEYLIQCEKFKFDENTRPLLFSVIQGGYDKELRKKCAEELIKVGFDGYGYGGYVIDEATNSLNLEISKFVADLIPNDKFKFALGNGKPEDIIALYKMGWQIFDCTLPTRDARHKRLYVSKNGNPQEYEYLYINKVTHQLDFNSIDNSCDCHACQNFSRAYLHHLFKIKDMSAYRLASIHNLRFYTRLVESLQS